MATAQGTRMPCRHVRVLSSVRFQKEPSYSDRLRDSLLVCRTPRWKATWMFESLQVVPPLKARRDSSTWPTNLRGGPQATWNVCQLPEPNLHGLWRGSKQLTTYQNTLWEEKLSNDEVLGGYPCSIEMIFHGMLFILNLLVVSVVSNLTGIPCRGACHVENLLKKGLFQLQIGCCLLCAALISYTDDWGNWIAHPATLRSGEEGGQWRLWTCMEGERPKDRSNIGAEENIRCFSAYNGCTTHLSLDHVPTAVRPRKHHQIAERIPRWER